MAVSGSAPESDSSHLPQYQGLLRWIKVKPHNIDHFPLSNWGSLLKLEGFNTMGLQVVGLPYAMNRGVAHRHLLGQPTSTQCVTPSGGVKVVATISAGLIPTNCARRPGLGSSCSPSTHYHQIASAKDKLSVPTLTPSEMVLLFRPSAAANMMSARRTNFCGVVGPLFHLSNVSRSAPDPLFFLLSLPCPIIAMASKVIQAISETRH